jgi:hypothetical protein
MPPDLLVQQSLLLYTHHEQESPLPCRHIHYLTCYKLLVYQGCIFEQASDTQWPFHSHQFVNRGIQVRAEPHNYHFLSRVHAHNTQ